MTKIRAESFYFINPALTVSAIRSSLSSGASPLSAERHLRTAPHFLHLCVMIKPFPDGSADTASITPPQPFALSPGLISRCREHRQYGQWFRDEYPSGGTYLPHSAQTKPLSFFLKSFSSICQVTGTAQITRYLCIRTERQER